MIGWCQDIPINSDAYPIRCLNTSIVSIYLSSTVFYQRELLQCRHLYFRVVVSSEYITMSVIYHKSIPWLAAAHLDLPQCFVLLVLTKHGVVTLLAKLQHALSIEHASHNSWWDNINSIPRRLHVIAVQ